MWLRDNKLRGIAWVSDLVAAGERAAAIDGRHDRGGPHRLLAILYAEAPRIFGPGDRGKARRHLAELLAIAGDDSENQLAAARVYLALGEKAEARAWLAKVDPDREADEATRREYRDERARLLRLLE